MEEYIIEYFYDKNCWKANIVDEENNIIDTFKSVSEAGIRNEAIKLRKNYVILSIRKIEKVGN